MKRNDKRFEIAYGLYLEGLSLSQVAFKMKCTRQSIYKAFKLRGFKLRGINFQPVQFFDGKKFTLRAHGYYELTIFPRTLMHRYVWQKLKGNIPKGWDIHHLDHSKSNNIISNLECISKAEHARKYSTGHNQFTKKGELLASH